MIPITIKVRFPIGKKVWHLINPEENVGLITGYIVRPDAEVLYQVTWSDLEVTNCYGMEITDEKSF